MDKETTYRGYRRSLALGLFAFGGLLGACTLAKWGIDDTSPAALMPSQNSANTAGLRFGFDTTEVDVPGTVHGAPGVSLNGHLADSSGKRVLQITHAGQTETLAEAGWHLPPVAAGSATKDVLICWSDLTGPEPAAEFMPSPSSGVSLDCRVLSSGVLGPLIAVAGKDAPSWLSDLAIAPDGSVDVKFHRNASGLLFAPRQASDGLYAAHYTGGQALQPARLLEDLSPK